MSVDTQSNQQSSPSMGEMISGSLIGMAVGDALGLPREGLKPLRARRIFGDELRHRLFLGRGMISDDTEHACMTGQAILASKGDVGRFRKSLAWKLRWWLMGVPAGIGLGTLRSILKLWIGISPTKSGARSAGNGPAMRAPIIGVLGAGNPEWMEESVRASTLMTHRDIRADEGALVTGAAAEFSASNGGKISDWNKVLSHVRKYITQDELSARMDLVERHLIRGSDPEELSHEMGQANGVSGYINNTVPVAIYCWLRFPDDYASSVSQAIRLGGDSDTVGAITGALAGQTVGLAGIPAAWIEGMMEWPRTVSWILDLADRLALFHEDHHDSSISDDSIADDSIRPKRLFWPGQFARNLFFAAVVLTHGFRRLFPPY